MATDEKAANRAAELRRKAEEKIASQPLTETAVDELYGKRLIHELQVHQAELEMQNEELKLSHADMELQLKQNAELIEELKKAKTQAEAANHTKTAFLNNMSHELRTPLNGVLGMAQLLDFTEMTEEQKKYVSTLAISAHNLLSLIDEILDLSKISGEKILFAPAKFDLPRCIRDAASVHSTAINDKGLTLYLDVAEEIPKVLIGDKLLIKQVLLHLFGNALKFTVTGGIIVLAKIIEKHDNSLLIQILISDSGIGINAKDIDEIFKPFNQADNSSTRNFGGVGIGLSVCRSLAELMGGKLTVKSIPDKGSRFSLTLPFSN